MSDSKPLIVAVAVLAATAGFAGYWLYYRSTAPAQSWVVVPAGQALSAPANVPSAASTTTAEPATARVIPDRVPAVKLMGLDGKVHALADFHDATLIINFWATWCVPCRREIPLLRKLRHERHAEGVEVVGIAVDFNDSVAKYLASTPLDYPLLVGEEDGLAAAEAFGMDLVLPFTIFADSQRRIVTVKVGELHADEAAVIVDAVHRINSKTLDLAVAKAELAAKIRELAALRAQKGALGPGR